MMMQNKKFVDILVNCYMGYTDKMAFVVELSREFHN